MDLSTYLQQIRVSSRFELLTTHSNQIATLTKITENQSNLYIFFFFEYYPSKRTFIFLIAMIFEVLYFLKMCLIFVGTLHNFGRSHNDMI